MTISMITNMSLFRPWRGIFSPPTSGVFKALEIGKAVDWLLVVSKVGPLLGKLMRATTSYGKSRRSWIYYDFQINLHLGAQDWTTLCLRAYTHLHLHKCILLFPLYYLAVECKRKVQTSIK